MFNSRKDLAQHDKLMVASNETGSICECTCGSIHLTFGPAVLSFTRHEFMEIAALSMAAVKHLDAEAEAYLLQSIGSHSGRMQ